MTFEEAKNYLLDRARAQGLEVEVLASEHRELTIASDQGRTSDLTQATRGGLGVRLVEEGRTGYAYTEERSHDALDWVLNEALENARLQTQQDGFLPEGRELGRTDLLSEGLSAPLERKAQAAQALERALRADERTAQISVVRYTERETSETLASTRGADGGYRNGASVLLASFVMQEGGSVKQGFGVEVSKEFHDLDPMRTSQKMLQDTGRLLGAKPLPTGRYRAYLEPSVVADLLQVLAFALSGKTLTEGRSRFEGRLGERVANELVTLIDDPTLPRGLASRPFDSEGTPARRLPLIENGVLRSFMHNSYTARRAGHENTGHAHRQYSGTLDVRPTNLLLEPGDGVELEDGVLVTEFMGLHAGANPITGDLSLQALGLRYEGGESWPVENLVMSGNLFELLERVSGLGRETEQRPNGVVAPVVRIEDVSFAGA